VHGIDEPVRTITGANRGELALVAPFLVRHGHYSHRSGAGLLPGRGAGLFRGQRVTSPLATVCATNDKHLVAAFLTKHYGGVVGHEIERPIGTVTAKDHHALSVAYLTKFYGTSIGADMRQPLPTVTAGGDRGGGHIAAVRAFLIKYYGASGKPQAQGVLEPLHTVTTKARFGLVTIAGEDYAIADIGMRMLQPHELYAAQGFPEWYQIAPEFDGKPLTKTAQIKLCGNSVSPRVARALVAENVRVAA
jgi:DNA (cytosine-5)-methyltransferase 1